MPVPRKSAAPPSKVKLSSPAEPPTRVGAWPRAGIGGRARTGAGAISWSSSPAGTAMASPHLEHLTFRPAAVSGARSMLPQLPQVTVMGMGGVPSWPDRTRPVTHRFASLYKTLPPKATVRAAAVKKFRRNRPHGRHPFSPGQVETEDPPRLVALRVGAQVQAATGQGRQRPAVPRERLHRRPLPVGGRVGVDDHQPTALAQDDQGVAAADQRTEEEALPVTAAPALLLPRLLAGPQAQANQRLAAGIPEAVHVIADAHRVAEGVADVLVVLEDPLRLEGARAVGLDLQQRPALVVARRDEDVIVVPVAGP